MENKITFKVAKLAKEKGFNEPCEYVHDNFGNIEYQEDGPHKNSLKNASVYYSAATQSELQAWIRNIHKININIKHIPHNQKYGYNITGSYHEGTHGILKSYDFKSFETYEEALEDALEESLKMIPKPL